MKNGRKYRDGTKKNKWDVDNVTKFDTDWSKWWSIVYRDVEVNKEVGGQNGIYIVILSLALRALASSEKDREWLLDSVIRVAERLDWIIGGFENKTGKRKRNETA